MVTVVILSTVAIVAAYFIALLVVPHKQRRTLRHNMTFAFGIFCTLLAMIPLLLLMKYLIEVGLPGILNPTFYLNSQKPVMTPGTGFQHAIFGSLMIVGIASAIGVPIGVAAGVYLAEVGKGPFANAIRLLAEVLTGLPSIIAGVLGYSMLVLKARPEYSAFAGAVALSFLMIPVITRVTEEAVRLVPRGLREASFGLGAGDWITVWKVVLPSARGAIMTGIVLAIARVGGETAPLLLTTSGRASVNWNPFDATAAIPPAIYQNSQTPFEDNQKVAIAGALFLVLWVAIINLGVRQLESHFKRKMAGG